MAVNNQFRMNVKIIKCCVRPKHYRLSPAPWSSVANGIEWTNFSALVLNTYYVLLLNVLRCQWFVKLDFVFGEASMAFRPKIYRYVRVCLRCVNSVAPEATLSFEFNYYWLNLLVCHWHFAVLLQISVCRTEVCSMNGQCTNTRQQHLLQWDKL